MKSVSFIDEKLKFIIGTFLLAWITFNPGMIKTLKLNHIGKGAPGMNPQTITNNPNNSRNVEQNYTKFKELIRADL